MRRFRIPLFLWECAGGGCALEYLVGYRSGGRGHVLEKPANPAVCCPGRGQFMLTQLRPWVPLDTPKGPGDAFAIIDYGEQAPLLFCCFLRSSGEQWTFDSRQVRLEKNVTMGIRTEEPGGKP